MVKKNEYTRKTNVSKDGVQVSEPVNSNYPQKTVQKDGEFVHKENNTRISRPSRENQARENNYQKEYHQRDNQKRESIQRDNQPKENVQRDNISKESQHNNNHQRNYHNNTQNRDSFNREPYRQHSQRPVIKPRAEETVEDIAADIGRIEKEIELELREINSLRLGM